MRPLVSYWAQTGLYESKPTRSPQCEGARKTASWVWNAAGFQEVLLLQYKSPAAAEGVGSEPPDRAREQTAHPGISTPLPDHRHRRGTKSHLIGMAFFSGLVILALMVSAEGGVGPSTNLSFCTESKECLEYELVCTTQEYEVRHYSPTRWVSTDAEAYFMGVGAAMAFRRLFQYITGANDGGVQMEMTAPVLVRIPEDTRVWEPAVYTLNFLLPSAYQERPPVPTNDKLYFTDMPDMNVYVRSYGGWMLSVTSRLHAHLLTQELHRVHAPYNHTSHYGVGYDSPLKLLNRHNEVWYVAEGDPVCTDPQEPTPAHTPTPTHTPSSDTPPHTPSSPPLSPSHIPPHTAPPPSSSSSSLPPSPSSLGNANGTAPSSSFSSTQAPNATAEADSSPNTSTNP